MKTVDEAQAEFRPGVYRHYKGNLYAAHMIVAHHETRRPMVLYTSLVYGTTQVREYHSVASAYAQSLGVPPEIGDADAWTDVMPSGVLRFTYVGPTAPAPFVREVP